ncbi:MAG: hypothetical protein CVT99_03755 [Bacteroidetes bacterium HGW-Bacteroidetes-16]|jgi:4-amino-4-deoxy-L-arabinose transferase-like glycosyltransferase|nr:MAG: hypothetical protein CVT99_03755 [Bacteroidetes bacterium HGW-Bacteroidetes-16]
MDKRTFFAFFFSITLLYLYSMWKIDLMENDATQYATICQQMAEDNSWLSIHWREVEYLDKPPLLFWTSAMLFKVFGSSHFVYRLPSFLVLLLGVYSVFQLGRKLYDPIVARLAVLIFYSSLAVFLMVHDVRTDTMLTGFVIFSLWQLYLFLGKPRAIHFFGAFTGIGLAMLTKGPLGLIMPIIAFVPYFLIKRQWKDIFRWEWLAGLVWIAVLLVPMIISLYGQHGASGLKFYFWTQSFGRFTGENQWMDDTKGLFFIHTFLWAFLPWSVLGFKALIGNIIHSVKGPVRNDFFLLSSVVLIFVAMSFSQYKLPHYIYVVFPMLSLLIAKDLMEMEKKSLLKPWLIVQAFIGGIVLLLSFIIVLFVFPGFFIWGWAVLVAMAVYLTATYLSNSNLLYKTVVVSLFSILALNFVMATHFYPKLLNYQASSQLAFQMKEFGYIPGQVCYLDSHRPAFDFYYGHRVPDYKTIMAFDSALAQQPYLYTIAFDHKADSICCPKYQIDTLLHRKGFKVSQLTLPFLNYRTRPRVLKDYFLLKVKLNH